MRPFRVDRERWAIEGHERAGIPGLIEDAKGQSGLPDSDDRSIGEAMLIERHVELQILLELHRRTVTEPSLCDLDDECVRRSDAVPSENRGTSIIGGAIRIES